MFRPAYNLTDRPVPIDPSGRQLGGLEWGPVDTTTDEVRTAVDSGHLVIHPGDGLGDDAGEEVKVAAAAAVARQRRLDAYRAADVNDVRIAAEAAGLPVDDGAGGPLRTKTELVADLIYVDDDPTDLLGRAQADVPAGGRGDVGTSAADQDPAADVDLAEPAEPARSTARSRR